MTKIIKITIIISLIRDRWWRNSHRHPVLGNDQNAHMMHEIGKTSGRQQDAWNSRRSHHEYRIARNMFNTTWARGITLRISNTRSFWRIIAQVTRHRISDTSSQQPTQVHGISTTRFKQPPLTHAEQKRKKKKYALP